MTWRLEIDRTSLKICRVRQKPLGKKTVCGKSLCLFLIHPFRVREDKWRVRKRKCRIDPHADRLLLSVGITLAGFETKSAGLVMTPAIFHFEAGQILAGPSLKQPEILPP
jgi:hypothetical protein